MGNQESRSNEENEMDDSLRKVPNGAYVPAQEAVPPMDSSIPPEQNKERHQMPAESVTSSSRSRNTPILITDSLSDVRVRYHITSREIGHGHYGVVRKCMDRETKQWYAIKSIRKSKVSKIEILKRETQILKEVNHPNIIRLIEVHEDAKYLHLITELCTGGELFDRIIEKTQSDEGHFSERDAAKLVHSILDAIRYCHEEMQIVHRDLKPENFLFSSKEEDATIKIIDFGLSRHEEPLSGIMKTKVGTPYYVAPEVLSKRYTKSCDIWSIGVIAYILLCGYPPFYGDSDNQIFESVRSGRFDFPSPEWDTVSDAAKDFICSLVKIEPRERLTASEALNHTWIQEQMRCEKVGREIIHTSERSGTFKKFIGMQKLKKAALGYIATNLSPAEVGYLGDIFRKIDTDGDGRMSLQEIDMALMREDFSLDLQERLHHLKEDLSLSGEETLYWKDFLASMMDKSLLIKEDKIRMAFEHFRQADDNCLRMSNLVQIFGGPSTARDIMGDIETYGDRLITYEEFRVMMTVSFND